jgi:hypothetical protein
VLAGEVPPEEVAVMETEYKTRLARLFNVTDLLLADTVAETVFLPVALASTL